MSTTLQQTNSLAELLSMLPDADRKRLIRGLSDEQQKELLYDWKGVWARPNQLPPPGDWRYWLALAGRGWGKTRSGAEVVREWASKPLQGKIHLVARTTADVRTVMIEGDGGLLSCYPPNNRPHYEPSRRQITWPNGNVALTFSADEPESLRGPQCERFWADEIAAWPNAELAWDNLMFGFRIGDVRGVITTTPKPIKIIRDLLANPATAVTRGTSYENRLNLAPEFFATIIRKYEGTRLGRQELMAEVLDDIPGALWTRSMIENARVPAHRVPQLVRVVIGVDPSTTSGEGAAETGIVAVGLSVDRHLWVLGDDSIRGTPNDWARAACRALLKHNGDRIVAEVNNGGDLVETNIRTISPDVPYKHVWASRGKRVRAEPAAALYEQGRVHHVGTFEALEDQMCTWVPDAGLPSPDRMDALVWACYDLLLQSEDRAVVTAGQDIIQRISPY